MDDDVSSDLSFKLLQYTRRRIVDCIEQVTQGECEPVVEHHICYWTDVLK